MTERNDNEPRASEQTIELPCIDVPVSAGSDVRAEFAARTDTGLVREHNEDSYVVVEDAGVYLVADGMGGHNAGRLASEICVEVVESFYEDRAEVDADEASLPVTDPSLAESLHRANHEILEKSCSAPEFSGMGTTAVGFRLTGNKVNLAHAGDSRAYLFRESVLRQLTMDHSLGNFLRALGREGEAAMAEATMSNVIMRALGLEPEIEIETSHVFVQPGDRLLLCSDGLSDLVGDEEIRISLMARRHTRDEVVEYLVEQALDAGGRDNITVLLVDIFAADHVEPDALRGGTLLLAAGNSDEDGVSSSTAAESDED